MIGFPIPRNKAIIGENAFAHESGIHQHGMLSHRETYEIMTPESVGRDATKIVLGRHSGMHGFRTRLAEIGFVLEESDIKRAYEAFLKVADRKKEIYDEDLYTILSEQFGTNADSLILEYVHFQSGNTTVPTATVRVRDHDEVHEEAATGDGPVDAVFRAIERACGTDATLVEYNVAAVTPGKQALGETSVVIEIDGKRTTGRGASTDILEASAKAYVNALSRHRLLKEVIHP
jgi:2-isopropylmalate synthase